MTTPSTQEKHDAVFLLDQHTPQNIPQSLATIMMVLVLQIFIA
jgi:hypothetical protein